MTPSIVEGEGSENRAISPSENRSAALRAEPPAGSQAKPAAAITDVLDRAADAIKGLRLTRGSRINYGVLSHHLAQAALPSVLSGEHVFLRKFLGVGSLTVWLHNTAHSQVVAKLREAAAKAREQVSPL